MAAPSHLRLIHDSWTVEDEPQARLYQVAQELLEGKTERVRADHFYLDSRDAHHQSTELRTKIAPEGAALIGWLRDRDEFPYKTNADVVRDAIVHLAAMRMRQLAQDPPPEILEWLAAHESERLLQLNERRRDDNKRLELAIRELTDNEDWDALVELVARHETIDIPGRLGDERHRLLDTARQTLARLD